VIKKFKTQAQCMINQYGNFTIDKIGLQVRFRHINTYKTASYSCICIRSFGVCLFIIVYHLLNHSIKVTLGKEELYLDILCKLYYWITTNIQRRGLQVFHPF